MRPRNARRINRALIAAALAALTLAGTGTARADGVLTDAEAAYVTLYGATAICPVLDLYPHKAGLMGIAAGIMDDGWAADSAADIVNAAVYQYCPRHWQLLVNVGREARGERIAAI